MACHRTTSELGRLTWLRYQCGFRGFLWIFDHFPIDPRSERPGRAGAGWARRSPFRSVESRFAHSGESDIREGMFPWT